VRQIFHFSSRAHTPTATEFRDRDLLLRVCPAASENGLISMPRNLTSRQLKFAAAVAGGKAQTAAYKEAGYATNGKPRTAVRNARALAQNAEVRASIREMQLQLLPAPGDMKAVYEHGLATILQLTKCEDSKVRLAAAEWLCAEAEKQAEKRKTLEAEKRETLEAAGTGDPRELLSQLEALYRKALPELEPLVEEVSDEMADGQAWEAPAKNLQQVAEPLVEVAAEDAPPAKSVAEFLEEISQPPPTEAEVPQPPAPEPRYEERLVSKPGHFPPQFMKVPVR